MAKKSTKPAVKGKNKVENKIEPTPPPPKKDTPPPDNTNIAAVEPPPPHSPPPAPVPPPAAEVPIPIPPPKDPPASAKFETPKSPSINSNWTTSPSKAAPQEVPDDGERSDQAWGKPGQTDDMYWTEDQAHAADYQRRGEGEWDQHDDEDYDDNYDQHYDKDYDDAQYADMNQPSGTHPHNSPAMGSQHGWDQPTSNWEHPDTTPPPGPGTPVQGHRGGGSIAGGNTPNEHPSALLPAGPGSESGGGYRSPWRIDGKPPDKVHTASAAARKTVAFAGVKPTPPSSNQGHPPSQPAPLQLPKISQASKQAGPPHGGGEDWGFGVPPGAAWGGPEPARTWDHAPSAPVTSHAAPPTSRAHPANPPFAGGWTQWVKEAKGVASVTKITANVPTAPPPPPAPPQQGARTSSVPSAGGRLPSAHHQHPHSLAAMLAHAQRGLAQAHLHQVRSPTFPMPNIPGGYEGYPQYMQPGGYQRPHSTAAPPPPPPPPPHPGAHQQHPQGGTPWANLVHGPGHGPGPYGGQDPMAAQQKPSKKSKGGDPKSPPMQQQDSWGTWTGTDNWDSPMGDGAGYGPAGGGASAGGWGGSTGGGGGGGGGGHGDGWKDPGGGNNDGWGGAAGDWTDPGAGGGWDDKGSKGGWDDRGSKGGWDDKGSKGGWGDSGSKGGRRDSGSKGGWGGPSGAGDWGGGGGGAGGAGAWHTIAEEDEEEEEGDSYDEGWDDEEEDYDDDGWGTQQSTHQSSQGHQKRASQSHAQPSQGYYQTPQSQPSQTGKYGVPKSAQSHASSSRRKDQQQTSLPYDPSASYTMNMVYGRTVAELAPPPQSAGQLIFVESHGDSLRHAQNAMYSTLRPAAERIRWGFRPENDPRVMSVLYWIKTYSDGIAALGLRRFLKTGKRGVLIANAEYRVNDDKVVNQPAFDWVTIKNLQPTWDKTLQESVICYNPRIQVVVIVFLLSKSGKSMAVWRRKLPLPESLRRASQKNIEAIMAKLDAVPRDKAYVDVLPPAKPEVKARSAEPPPPPKKKSWWKRLFNV